MITEEQVSDMIEENENVQLDYEKIVKNFCPSHANLKDLSRTKCLSGSCRKCWERARL